MNSIHERFLGCYFIESIIIIPSSQEISRQQCFCVYVPELIDNNYKNLS